MSRVVKKKQRSPAQSKTVCPCPIASIAGIIAETEPPTLETAEKLVLETVRHVRRLGKLSSKFPEQFKAVARQMPAWPAMDFKRGDGAWDASRRLELAEDYPLDTSFDARSHPSSLTGQYLTRWIECIHCFRLEATGTPQGARLASVLCAVTRCDEILPAGRKEQRGELKSILQLAVRMPPLTKGTSIEWGRRVLIPLIMLSDAGTDEISCREPSLKAIWRQRGVKSLATFKSRLLTKVRQTLRSLARPS
jgi:hypothetical protein